MLTKYRFPLAALLTLILVGIALAAQWAAREQENNGLRKRMLASAGTRLNLLRVAAPFHDSSLISGTVTVAPDQGTFVIGPSSTLRSNLIDVRPGNNYRYGLVADAATGGGGATPLQVRALWYSPALTVTSWNDSPPLTAEGTFHTSDLIASGEVSHLSLEVSNSGSGRLTISGLSLISNAPYVEPHPYGAFGSVAISFDWETAMGGAIHSRGMSVHDPEAAAQHGLQMRQGADWFRDLFAKHDVRATFYANGYNLLDGNTERRRFAGNPIYRWASPKNGWPDDYWLRNRWYSDDPYGTTATHPEWYFGDQTLALAGAGHEIGSHTFGHLYVRGSNPEELGIDAGEWVNAARDLGLPAPSTFAFPWRSSNSLTPDFYRVLYDRGIRAVTRLYERDLKSLYTIGAAPVFSDIAVMPDFLLEVSGGTGPEEAAGERIGLQRGLEVIDEVLARRGSTSFWTHPEQLAPGDALKPVRDAWSGVVERAARERDRGLLWIATVGEITSYQQHLREVSARLERTGDRWRLAIQNDGDTRLNGVTITLPGEFLSAGMAEGGLQVVNRAPSGEVVLQEPSSAAYPARQVVISELAPGTTSVDITWAPDQEPVP